MIVFLVLSFDRLAVRGNNTDGSIFIAVHNFNSVFKVGVRKNWQTLPFLGKGANANEAQGKRIRCLFNIPAEKVELFNQN